MRVLAVTNMMPTPENPRAGTFVEQQIRGLEAIGCEVRVLFIDRSRLGKRAYRSTRPMLREALVKERPDLVHVMYGGVMAELATRVVGSLATVVSFCGTDLLGEESGPVSLRVRAAIGVWCSRRAARRAHHLVVKSRNLELALPRSIDRGRVTIIPNGVNLERFRPLDRAECRGRLGWSADAFHVLFSTGEMGGSNKRLPLAEAAVDHLRAHGVDAVLQIMRSAPHDEVPLWLNAADAVILTSMHEGSPNIVKEALACNRSVVSVAVGDVAERIEALDGCFLAEPSADHLAEKLALVHAGAGCTGGRARMEELSVERVAERLLGVYRQAVERSRGMEP